MVQISFNLFSEKFDVGLLKVNIDYGDWKEIKKFIEYLERDWEIE